MGGSGNQIDHKTVHETDDLKMEYIHHKQWLRILSNTELLNEHYRWLMRNDISVATITRGLESVGCPDIHLGLVASLAHALKVLQIERADRLMMNWSSELTDAENLMRSQAKDYGVTEDEYRKALRSKLGQGQSSGASDGTGTSSTPPPESSGPSESESPPSSQPELQQ